MLTIPDCLSAAAWGSAVLDGRVPLARVPDGARLNAILAALRDGGVRALYAVIPVPGDPVGLSDPAITARAMDAGGIVVGEYPQGQGPTKAVALIPSADGWERVATRWQPIPLESASSHRRALAEAMQATTAELVALNVAAWPHARADALADLQEALIPDDALPPGAPPSAWSTLETALRLRAVLALALQDDGGALAISEIDRRRRALRQLDDVARRAAMAVVNTLTSAAR